MAFDCFLKIDGIEGESTDSAHANWIEVVKFNHAMSQTTSSVASTAGGATSGRVNMDDFTIVKRFDKATPKIADYCCTGKHIPTIVMHLCRQGTEKLLYQEVKLTNSIVSSITHDGENNPEDLVPLETVKFNFGKIEWTYTQQKRADGAGGGNVAAGWDLQRNVKV